MNRDLLNEIDELLCKLEDFTHGKDGEEITKLRTKISKATTPSLPELRDEYEKRFINPYMTHAQREGAASVFDWFASHLQPQWVAVSEVKSYCPCCNCPDCGNYSLIG